MAYSRQDIAFINNARKIVSDFNKKKEAAEKKMQKIDEECIARANERKQPHLCKIETYNISIDLWNKKMQERFGLTVEEAVSSLEAEDIFSIAHVEEPDFPLNDEAIAEENEEGESESFNWEQKILG